MKFTKSRIETLSIDEKVEAAVKKAKRQSRLAKVFKVSRQFINQVVSGDRPFPIDREDDLDQYLLTGRVTDNGEESRAPSG